MENNINTKKSLSSKILSNNELNVCSIIKEFEPTIYSIISNILILLKDNEKIYHTNNYIFYNYDDNYNNIISGEIPIMILLGGMSYKIYSLFYNKYFKEDILNLNNCLIDSIDYDFSIIVKPEFDKNIFRSIVKSILDINAIEFLNIDNNKKIQNIEKKRHKK